jgi:hypothetical protein
LCWESAAGDFFSALRSSARFLPPEGTPAFITAQLFAAGITGSEVLPLFSQLNFCRLRGRQDLNLRFGSIVRIPNLHHAANSVNSFSLLRYLLASFFASSSTHTPRVLFKASFPSVNSSCKKNSGRNQRSRAFGS